MHRKVLANIKRLSSRNSKQRLVAVRELISALSYNENWFAFLVLDYLRNHDPNYAVKNRINEFLAQKGYDAEGHWESHFSF